MELLPVNLAALRALSRRPLAPIAVALVLGCASAARGPAPAPPAPGASAPLPRPEVRLLEAGDGPRRRLRHSARPGEVESVVFEIGSSLSLAVGDLAPPEVRSPPVRITLELRAGDADERGRLTFTGRVVRIEVLPAADLPAGVVAGVASDLEPLAGAALGAAVTAVGVLERLELAAPGDGSPQLAATLERLRDGLRRLLPPLPDEPVGRGARWQVRTRLSLGPATVEETATYRLTDGDGGRARLAIELTHRAAEQPLVVPALPPGATVTLASLSGAGTGTAELRPGGLVHPAELHWAASATGTSRPAGEPPAPVRLATTGSLTVTRPR